MELFAPPPAAVKQYDSNSQLYFAASPKAMVKLGLGISVLHYGRVGQECRRGALRILRPTERRLLPFGVLSRKSEYRPKILDAFLKVAREWKTWWPLADYVLAEDDAEV